MVFDIDDTILFDNSRSGPNLQVLEFLKDSYDAGHKIHLVTARSLSARSDTIAELKRSRVPFHSLDLATEKQRDSMASIAEYKFACRKKYGPVFVSFGDQWGDVFKIREDKEIELLDNVHQCSETPWIVVEPEDGVTRWGVKLMSA